MSNRCGRVFAAAMVLGGALLMAAPAHADPASEKKAAQFLELARLHLAIGDKDGAATYAYRAAQVLTAVDRNGTTHAKVSPARDLETRF